jgi:hypothetical protein
MAFGPGGKLYVSEAGRGGAGGCVESPEGGLSCVGRTGAIARVNVHSGTVRRILKALPSHAVQTGETPGANAIGPQDVSFRHRRAYFTIGFGSDPAKREELGKGARRFAGLYRIGRRGGARRVADLGAYEQANNPDEGQPTATVDTNPFSVDATGRKRILVTDAGGNDLLSVSRSGRVRTVAVFPFGMTAAPPFLGLPPGTQIPYQPVPTGVLRAPRGAAYVGQLTGFPFPVGAANVFHVEAGGDPQVHAGGFTNVVDIARGRNGVLYVLQISSAGLLNEPPLTGKLVRVAADGSMVELATGLLEHPTGLAVAGNGDLYVVNHGTSPDGGQIVRIADPG